MGGRPRRGPATRRRRQGLSPLIRPQASARLLDVVRRTLTLIRVEQGKGKKDRTVMLSQSLLEELRSCWRRYAPKCYLLEGKRPGQPIDKTPKT